MEAASSIQFQSLSQIQSRRQVTCESTMKVTHVASKKCVELLPVILNLLIQIAFAWVSVFYRLAQVDGMNLRVIIAYRLLFASAFLVPLAILFESHGRYKIDKTVIFHAFLSALFGGVIAQNLYLQSLALTTATFASSMINLIPGVTFVLAAALRMEKVGLAKVVGTLTGMGGAMLLTFYKGPALKIHPFHVVLVKNSHSRFPGNHPLKHNFLAGAFFGLADCFSFAIWLIIQAKMIQRYPYPYTATALMSAIGAALSIVFTLCIDRNLSQWKLGWDIRLATVAYSGIVVSGISFTIVTWCMKKTGPLFVSAFYPVMLIASAVVGSFFLGETLHLGSALGSIVIVFGLYLVLWGKSKDLKPQLPSTSAIGEEKEEPLKISLEQLKETINPQEEDDQNSSNSNPKPL